MVKGVCLLSHTGEMVSVATKPEDKHFFGTSSRMCFFIEVKIMRRFLIIFCLVAIFFSSGGCDKNYTHGVYELSISAYCISNDSVGDEWEKSYSCGGKPVSDGQCGTIPLDTAEEITLDITITERDKYCDVGTDSLEIELIDGYEAATVIVVSEDNGRYTSNKARWKISCAVKLIEKVEQ